MMGIYLYCFTPPPALPGPELAGIHGDPVTSLDCRKLSLWVDLPEVAPRATLDSVKAHHAVVRAAWTTSPACLPARFGQWFQERAALEKAVAEKGAALERALQEVEGAGEHGVRIVEPEATEASGESDPEPPHTGRAYLESLLKRDLARQQRNQRAEAMGRELETALLGAIRAQRAEPLKGSHGLLSVAHLVASDRQDEYRDRLAGFRTVHPELRFLVSGPWPPYSFAP